ncbi:hypothetical protein [Psychrosphaera algicola]|uniref:Lipoprotein n=1 Tax=Psychrosphaera algicola TaxID=3023714 RepID=A0ABT5FCQ2_9GAMM|nr:hypothetical protein [Psychrosphaera sp. G1-22]MDC2889323.1 hypothetical protein [Psychrosphaera sp. G1-22]
MLNIIKVTFLSIMFVSTGCAMAEDYERISESLPKALPRIIVVDSSSAAKGTVSNYSGLFATLMVTPKVRNGEYWKPKGLREAALELSRMLPPKFIERFSKYYGLGKNREVLNGYTPDSDIEERLYDLDQYLINTWGLATSSKLGKQFQCMGIFERDLHKFYVFWAGFQAEANGMSIETDISTEYRNLKSHLEKECGL